MVVVVEGDSVVVVVGVVVARVVVVGSAVVVVGIEVVVASAADVAADSAASPLQDVASSARPTIPITMRCGTMSVPPRRHRPLNQREATTGASDRLVGRVDEEHLRMATCSRLTTARTDHQ